MKTHAESWTVDDVCKWLKECKLDTYADRFKQHKIDGSVLLLLNETDLREKPLCVEVLGDIKRIAKEINLLKLPSVVPKKITPISPEQEKGNTSPITRDLATKLGSYSHNMLEKYQEFLPSILTAQLWHPHEKWLSGLVKLALSILYLFFAIFCTSFVMMICHERVPDTILYPPLPDIILDNVPHIKWAFKLSELLALSMGAILVSILIFHVHRIIILRRFCAITGSIFMLRCVTMFVTSLSVPGRHLSEECSLVEQSFGDWDAKLARAWTIASGFGLSVAGVTTCGDYMFSGHSSILTLLNLFINEYTPYNWKGLHIVTWCMNMFGMFFVLCAHEHYTLDVFCAFYISSRMFMHYHQMANIHHVVKKGTMAERERIKSWFPMFSYLESTTDGIIPNEYEFPFSSALAKKKKSKKK